MSSADTVLRTGTSPKEFVAGVDSTRFLAAIWVAFYHGAFIPVNQFVHGSHATTIAQITRLPFNGTASVVLFFIISGFCIHYPYAGTKELNWIAFLCKRMLRIVIPLLAIQTITSFLGAVYVHAVELVLWSVYCEVLYYLCYPLIRLLVVHVGLVRCLFASGVCSLTIAILNRHIIFLGDLRSETWVFCLPMWLLGCHLAVLFKTGLDSTQHVSLVWRWRLGGLAIASASMLLAHTAYPVGYIWSMPVFAIYSMYWLRYEFKHATLYGPVPWLERLGVGGYSIYLTHKIAIQWASTQFPFHRWYVVWPAELLVLTVTALCFFWLVEYPSHQLSKNVGIRIALLTGKRSSKHLVTVAGS